MLKKALGAPLLEGRRGGEALPTCKRHEGLIHVLKTDAALPQENGTGVSNERANRRRTPGPSRPSTYTENKALHGGKKNLLSKPSTRRSPTNQVGTHCYRETFPGKCGGCAIEAASRLRPATAPKLRADRKENYTGRSGKPSWQRSLTGAHLRLIREMSP